MKWAERWELFTIRRAAEKERRIQDRLQLRKDIRIIRRLQAKYHDKGLTLKEKKELRLAKQRQNRIVEKQNDRDETITVLFCIGPLTIACIVLFFLII